MWFVGRSGHTTVQQWKADHITYWPTRPTQDSTPHPQTTQPPPAPSARSSDSGLRVAQVTGLRNG
jgi:hypothetical protein